MPFGAQAENLKQLGAFELTEQIGCGAMGAVYKAKHPSFPGPVAIKIAHETTHQDPLLAKRFANEFAIGGRLVHPHLVNVLAFDVVEDYPLLVLEYVAGRSLDQHLKASGPLPMKQALALFQQIAQAVEFIHAHRMVHRDIKPANILIERSGYAKLADLGLIKDQESDLQVTLSRLSLGTPDYMAPEQFEAAKHADHRCDIYAMAGSLYVALTGSYPFGRGGPFQILLRKSQFHMTPLSQMLSNVSESLDHAMLSALHPDPNMRPDAITEFMDAATGMQPLKRPRIAPPAAPPVKPPGANRRAHERFDVTISAEIEFAAQAGQRVSAGVVDVSLSGLCLKLPQSAELGSVIQVHFLELADRAPRSFPVRCCWSKKRGDAWHAGCAFLQPLDSEGLEYLLRCGMSETILQATPPA